MTFLKKLIILIEVMMMNVGWRLLSVIGTDSEKVLHTRRMYDG
jgi:hypothetical protein